MWSLKYWKGLLVMALLSIAIPAMTLMFMHMAYTAGRAVSQSISARY